MISRFLFVWAAIGLPLLLSGCGTGGDETRTTKGDFPPLRYGYLPPINLKAGRLILEDGFEPSSGAGEVSAASPVNLEETLRAMARDRLKAAGSDGTASFRVETASITRRSDTLEGTLAVRLDLRDAAASNTGFAEARVTATKTATAAEQRAAMYEMMKSMMENMNVELEYQVRHQLREWLADAKPAPSPTPRPVGQLPLPLPPPPPPLAR